MTPPQLTRKMWYFHTLARFVPPTSSFTSVRKCLEHANDHMPYFIPMPPNFPHFVVVESD